jgi:hypothetical protein
MEDNQPKRETLAFTNPNRARVIKELDALIAEWRAWQEEVGQIKDHPYDREMQTVVYADGEANMKRHRILQEKTLTFLENNISGHGFIRGRDGTKIDRTDLRLSIRVKHRVDDLDELRACLDYAKVPDAHWKTAATELVDKIAGKAPGAAIELVSRYLQTGG